jgi:hypothetical protein
MHVRFFPEVFPSIVVGVSSSLHLLPPTSLPSRAEKLMVVPCGAAKDGIDDRKVSE